MIHLTGFGVFGPHEENPTQILIENLEPHKYLSKDGRNLVSTQVLPVQYGDAFKAVTPEIGQETQVVIHLGLSAKAKRWELELYAHNLCHSDPEPQYPKGVYNQACIVGGDELLKTGVDVFALVEHLNQGLDGPEKRAQISTSAGTYVCNDVYYRSLSEWGKIKQVLFVHIPSFSQEFGCSESHQKQNLDALIHWFLNESREAL